MTKYEMILLLENIDDGRHAYEFLRLLDEEYQNGWDGHAAWSGV